MESLPLPVPSNHFVFLPFFLGSSSENQPCSELHRVLLLLQWLLPLPPLAPDTLPELHDPPEPVLVQREKHEPYAVLRDAKNQGSSPEVFLWELQHFQHRVASLHGMIPRLSQRRYSFSEMTAAVSAAIETLYATFADAPRPPPHRASPYSHRRRALGLSLRGRQYDCRR